MGVVKKLKTCIECKETKELSEFRNIRKDRSWTSKTCKKCISRRNSKRNQLRYANDPEYKKERLEYARKRRSDPIKKAEIYRKQIERRLDPEYQEKERKYSRELQRKKNADPEYRRKRYDKENKKRKILRAIDPKFRKRLSKNNSRYKKKKYNSDLQYRLGIIISVGIYRALKDKKGGKNWQDLVGYDTKKLKKHLEKQFAGGMSWDNYGEWHIDHKIPQSAFNYTKPEHRDFKRCWALKNLQPLWAKDNSSKRDKLTKPFQPSLLI